MELFELRYALTTMKTGGFAPASRELFVSRQAVSQAVRNLEAQLGGPLFTVTDGNSLAPTEFGRTFLADAAPVLEAFDALSARYQPDADSEHDSITLALAMGVTLSLPKDYFARLRKANPDAKISVEESNTDAALDMLRRGQADLCMAGTHPELVEDLELRPVFVQGLFLGVPANNPLAHKDRLTVFDLDGQRLVTAGKLNHLHQFVMRRCQQAGVELEVPATSSSQPLLRSLAKEYNALAFVFPHLAGTEDDGRVMLPLDIDGAADFGTYALRRKGERRSRTLRKLWEELPRAAKKGASHGQGR